MAEQKAVICPHCGGTRNFSDDKICVHCKKDLTNSPDVNQHYFSVLHNICEQRTICVAAPQIIGNLNFIAKVAMFLGIAGSIRTFIAFIIIMNIGGTQIMSIDGKQVMNIGETQIMSTNVRSTIIFDTIATCILYIFAGFVFMVCFNWMAKILDILSKSEVTN